MTYVAVLATIMAVGAIVGYRYGIRLALLTSAVIWGALLLLSRSGGMVASLVNGAYFAVRFALAGGLQAMGGVGDRSAAMADVLQQLGQVKPVVKGDSAGVEFMVVLTGLILLAIVAGLSSRLRGPQSRLGLLLGLANGYLVGAYLLSALAPGLSLALPFGLPAGRSDAAPTAVLQTNMPEAAEIARQLATWSESASQRTMAWIVMIAIAAFIVGAIRVGHKGKKAS